MRFYFTLIKLVVLAWLFPLSAANVTIEVKTEGTLEQVVEDCDEPSLKELKITGRLNGADILYLRTGSGRIANVEALDLSDVAIVTGGGAYASISYSDNSVTMDNYNVTFYSSNENRKEIFKESNGLGGINYTINYYSNNLAGAFAGMKYKHVVMPKSVNEVGIMTFYECRELASVDYSQPLLIIEEKAFQSCTSLLDLDLSHVYKMGTSAFAGCKSFRSTPEGTLNLSSLDSIPDNAFGTSNNKYDGTTSCQSIKSIVFSNGLKSIGVNAFYKCTALETIVLPEGLETMGDNAFAYCSSLTTVTLPSTLRQVNADMFENTPYLQNSLTEEGQIVYWNTIALRFKTPSTLIENTPDIFLTFKEGTTEIADGFMKDVHSLWVKKIVGITLPSSLRRIGSCAFYGLANVKTIELPEGLEEIADAINREGAFMGCGLTSVVIPSKIKKIGSYAFCCTALETVSFPDGLEEIADNAFQGCSKIGQISLPSNLKIIGHNAFNGCSSLDGEITIPEKIEQLGSYIFKGANLWRIYYNAENAVNLGDWWDSSGIEHISYNDIFEAERIVIGANVRYLPKNAFSSASIKKVTFEDRTDDAELIIDECCFTGANITSITLPNGRIEIGGGAFYCQSLTSFKTLGVVTKICDTEGRTFGSQLTSVSFPDGLTYVGDNAFYGCSELTSVNLGSSVEYIGNSAFYECSMQNIQAGELLDSIGIQAFALCTKLKSFSFGKNLKKIGTGAFMHCEALEKAILPDCIEVIEGSAFACCYSLTDLYLPEGLKEIGDNALTGCDLSVLVIPSTVTKIGMYLLGQYNQSPDLNLNLKTIEVDIPNPIEITDNTVFLDYYFSNTTLRVPAASLQAYRKTYPWSQFNRIKGIGGENADNTLVTDEMTIPTGRTKWMAIELRNKNTDYTAFQFELVLPKGLTVATDANGNYVLNKGERFTDKNQSLTIEFLDNNRYRIVSVSLLNATIKGNEGILLTIPLHASNEMLTGNYNAYLEDVVFSKGDGTKHEFFDLKVPITIIDGSDIKMGDSNGDGVIDVTDAVAMINYIMEISTSSFSFDAADLNGDGEVDVFDVTKLISMILSNKGGQAAPRRALDMAMESIRLTANGNSIWMCVDHAERFTAFQFDVEVPDGTELMGASLINGNTSHQLQFAKMDENLYTVVGLSLNNESLSAGRLIELNLTGKASCDVRFSNIMFVNQKEEETFFNDDALGLSITCISGIQTSQVKNDVYDLSGRKLNIDCNQLRHGIYTINGQKVVIK